MAPVPTRFAPALVAIVVAAGALVAGIVVLLAAVRLPDDGAVVPVQRSAFRADGVRVDAVDTRGLEDDDTVLAVDGVAAGTRLRDLPGEGERVAYRVRRGGELRTVDVEIDRRDVGGALARDWGGAVLVPALALLGALLVWRRPDVPATRALLVLGSTATLAWLLQTLGPSPLDLWAGRWWFAAVGPVVLLSECAVLHFVLVFPSPGAVLDRRPRLVTLVYVVPLALHALDAAVSSAGDASSLEAVGAWSTPRLEALVVVATVAVPLLRLRRTTDPVARRQLRLVGLQLLGSGVAYFVVFALPSMLGGDPVLPTSFASATFWPFPVVLAVAVLRFDLFEIRLVAHRSLLYAALTAAVVGLYAAVVALVSAATGEHGGLLASAVAAGVVAVAIQPLRRWLHRAAGQLVYGAVAEPYEVLAQLGHRLEDRAHPGAVLDAAVSTVAASLSRPYAAIEVEGGEVVASAGSAPQATTSVPLVHQRAEIGRLVVGLRHEGEQLGPAEERLLADLAAHIGAALASTRLAVDVQRSRERLVAALEEERRRVGRDLHDGLGPRLAAASMKLEAADRLAQRDLDAGLALQGEVRADLQRAIGEVRRLVHGLRPTALDQLGLVAALQEQANRLSGREGHDLCIVVEGRVPDLPAAAEVAAYRIASEAMTNAARHAGAGEVRVRFDAGDDDLVVEVEDDGRGMPDPVPAGIGLTSMHERAAELGGAVMIEPAPGGGTRVVARLPLEAS
jgi:signal transduction histidine kinase